jgi:hypothetical protein
MMTPSECLLYYNLYIGACIIENFRDASPFFFAILLPLTEADLAHHHRACVREALM